MPTTQTVSLAINNLDEVAPAFTSGTVAAAIDENSGAGQVVYTAVASDPASDGGPSNPLSYGLSGTDAGAFSIDADDRGGDADRRSRPREPSRATASP